MPRMLLAVSALLLTLIVTARADVAPYPAWRIVTNGYIAGAAQSGGAIYLGGDFTKIGRGVAPFEAFLDPVNLTLTSDPGCARDGGSVLGTAADGTSRLIGRGQIAFGARLSDGAGPLVVGDDVRYVRVGSDCRFDRRFALRLPVEGALSGTPVYVADVLYSAVQVTPPSGPWYVAAFDARTGDLLHGWPAPNASSLVGIGANGRLALTHQVPGTPEVHGTLILGFFDVATGAVTAIDSLPGATAADVTPLGSRVLVRGPGSRLNLFDLATWQRLPAWPEVYAGPSGLAAASSARLLLDARFAGSPSRARLAAFDLDSGALDPSFVSPAWLDDYANPSNSSTRPALRQITIGGSRVIVSGDFKPGAPRDTIAALDLATGALDSWEFPYAPYSVARAGSLLHLGTISSSRRIERRYLAAVDAVTGDILSWDPGASLPESEFAYVTAVAQAGPFVYAAHNWRWPNTGDPVTVRRYELGSGARDTIWRLELRQFGQGTVNSLGVAPGVIYAIGAVDGARAGGVAPFETRNGGAAISLSGAVLPWDPRLSRCTYGHGYSFPCARQLAITGERVFLIGQLTFPGESRPRPLAGLDLATGALDPAIPSVSTSAITSAEGVLYANVTLEGRSRLVRVEAGFRTTVLPEALESEVFSLAARNGRLYAGVERDDATGAPTGNEKSWRAPLPADHGILDVEASFAWLQFVRLEADALALHADLTGVPPGRPLDLVASTIGNAVTLRWTRSPGDLQPLVPAPPAGGTAATSHVISASLAFGGAAIAQLDTASADTVFTVTAPSGVYFVRVLAKNAFGISEASNEVRVEVRPSAPDPPLALVATVIGPEVRVQWQGAPTGWPADGYVLEAGTREGAADLAVIPVNGIEFRAFQVPAGRYYVRVRAVNGHGASAPGQEVVVEVGS